MYSLEEIDRIVDHRIAKLKLGDDPAELYDPIDYLIKIGGKRLRPKIAILCYNLFKDDFNDSILMPAIGLEIFHGFTLIHDDIMDKAPIRRGHQTVHKKWNENIAILSGDVMCIKSYDLICEAPTESLPQLIKLFSKTAAEVCEGQQLDMNFESRDSVTMDEYLEMIGLKTAVLIACSASLGAIIAGKEDRVVGTIYDFSYQLGLAFQITDDYLDTFGTSSTFGKSIGGDIENNKKTWLFIEALNRAKGADYQELVTLYKGEVGENSAKVQKVKEIFERLGVKEAAIDAIEGYHTRAIEILKDIDLTDQQINQLEGFAKTLLKRNK